MSVVDISQLVMTLGFPIVMCGGLCYFVFWYIQKSDEKIDKLTEVVNNNTLVLQKILDKLNIRDDDSDEERFDL